MKVRDIKKLNVVKFTFTYSASRGWDTSKVEPFGSLAGHIRFNGMSHDVCDDDKTYPLDTVFAHSGKVVVFETDSDDLDEYFALDPEEEKRRQAEQPPAGELTGVGYCCEDSLNEARAAFVCAVEVEVAKQIDAMTKIIAQHNTHLGLLVSNMD